MSESVELSVLPPCDLCGDGTEAKYDGKMRGRSAWAYMCHGHWVSHGIGELGLGKGQELVLRKDEE